ncbi:acyl carrier protein [Streptantibioticus rubrisoli]|jgi:act minimal PKS acyl carrier protein|uniref:Acyl carrier protein n=1 Tax=Streptantibioticus rubrisoli TaxID=1387313 RepID=A0ABT1PJ58_9ACTN|nr:acyl carrier protein [Streptantibioticus rubrisoli]MCQ4044538.1 acyl carrier protein [Streptantibioticus rubrisoli]
MSDATEITIDDLKRIMRESAGEDESIDLDGDILEVPFAELGYDSLALLEAAGRITREYGVSLRDDELDGVETPRAFLDAVNAALVRV